MDMRTVNEKSPLHMTIVFTDEVGDPLIPTKVEWKLDDIETDTEIVPWTNLVSPASTMNMVIPGSNNTIGTETNVREERIFSIRADDGMPSEAHDEFQFHVINLYGPTGA